MHAFVTSRVDCCNAVFVGAPKSVTSKLQRVLNVAAWVVTGTRKIDRGLMQLLHADLHWLDVPERVMYELCMMMRRCQDGTAPQYLTAHCTPVSETASRQHLRLAASHQLTVPPHVAVIFTCMVVGRLLSPARRRGTRCRNVYATITVLLFLVVFFKRLFFSEY